MRIPTAGILNFQLDDSAGGHQVFDIRWPSQFRAGIQPAGRRAAGTKQTMKYTEREEAIEAKKEELRAAGKRIRVLEHQIQTNQTTQLARDVALQQTGPLYTAGIREGLKGPELHGWVLAHLYDLADVAGQYAKLIAKLSAGEQRLVSEHSQLQRWKEMAQRGLLRMRAEHERLSAAPEDETGAEIKDAEIDAAELESIFYDDESPQTSDEALDDEELERIAHGQDQASPTQRPFGDPPVLGSDEPTASYDGPEPAGGYYDRDQREGGSE